MRQQRVDPPGLMWSCAALWWQVGQGRARREVWACEGQGSMDCGWWVEVHLLFFPSPSPLSSGGGRLGARGAICKALTGRRRV